MTEKYTDQEQTQGSQKKQSAINSSTPKKEMKTERETHRNKFLIRTQCQMGEMIGKIKIGIRFTGGHLATITGPFQWCIGQTTQRR